MNETIVNFEGSSLQIHPHMKLCFSIHIFANKTGCWLVTRRNISDLGLIITFKLERSTLYFSYMSDGVSCDRLQDDSNRFKVCWRWHLLATARDLSFPACVWNVKVNEVLYIGTVDFILNLLVFKVISKPNSPLHLKFPDPPWSCPSFWTRR